MDTRAKILSPHEVSERLASGEWVAVVGLFDPLTAVQAHRFAELRAGRKTLAIVLEIDDALLSSDARAALIAGLRDVDAVVVTESDRWRTLIPKDARVEIVADPIGERARSAEFVHFVLRRQNA